MRFKHGADPLQLAAIPDHQQVVVEPLVGLLSEAIHARQELVHRRHRVRAHGRGHASVSLHEHGHRQRGAERVRLGVLVTDREGATGTP